MTKERKYFTPEFKQEAASLVLDQGSVSKKPVRPWGPAKVRCGVG